MMKDWLDASLFYVSNEPGFRVNTTPPRRTHTISLSSSMMYIRQIQIFAPMQILVQAQICMGASGYFTLVMSQGFVWPRTPGEHTPSRLAAR